MASKVTTAIAIDHAPTRKVVHVHPNFSILICYTCNKYGNEKMLILEDWCSRISLTTI